MDFYLLSSDTTFQLGGLVGQIIVEARDDLDKKADEIGNLIARKLKAVFENLAS